MRHLLPHQDAAVADVMAEGLRQTEQRARHASLHRQEARCRQCAVGVAQPAGEQHGQKLVNLRIGAAECLEHGAADEDHFRFAQRRDRCRARRAVDHRQFADNRARPEDRQDAFGAARRNHADLEQAVLDPVAAVAGVAGDKHHLVGVQRLSARLGEQPARQFARQGRKQVVRSGALVSPSGVSLRCEESAESARQSSASPATGQWTILRFGKGRFRPGTASS